MDIVLFQTHGADTMIQHNGIITYQQCDSICPQIQPGTSLKGSSLQITTGIIQVQQLCQQ